MRVGRDDAVGRGVAAVAAARCAGGRRPRGRHRRGGTGRPARPACPRASNTRTAPKATSTGSLKRMTTWSGALLQRRAALRRRRLQQRVRARRGRRDARDGERGRDQRRRRALTRPPSRRGRAAARGAGGARRRRRCSSAMMTRPTSEIDAQAAGRRRARRPEQRAPDRAGGRADLHRHRPVEDLRLLVHALDLRRRLLRHPVHAVVVPLEATGLRQDLPLRRALAVGARGRLRLPEAVLVQVVRGRVRVDLDGAVGLHAGVGLALVAARSGRPRRSCCGAAGGRCG